MGRNTFRLRADLDAKVNLYGSLKQYNVKIENIGISDKTLTDFTAGCLIAFKEDIFTIFDKVVITFNILKKNIRIVGIVKSKKQVDNKYLYGIEFKDYLDMDMEKIEDFLVANADKVEYPEFLKNTNEE